MDFNEADISLILGLGNVGSKFITTRHNSGFLFLDKLAETWQTPNWKETTKLHSYTTKAQSTILAKPNTMMNSSGKAASALLHYFQVEPESMLLVYDDLDITLGEYKLQFARFPKMHNGVKSVNQFLGRQNYWHLRLGIDNREAKGNAEIPGEKYALEKFSTEEFQLIQTTINQAINNYFTN